MTTKPDLRLLTRDDILGAVDRATEVVAVPEWGGAVTVKALSGTERDTYEAGMVTYRANGKGGMEVAGLNSGNVRARLVALSIVGSDGAPLFSEKDVLDLGDKSASALDRVFEAARRLSRITNADVEALTTGLKAGQNGSSGSG
jgi:hypothetical protein